MARSDLHNQLVEALGNNKRVYFQPPASIKLEYPCIIYERTGAWRGSADNRAHIKAIRYQVTHISREPDSPVIEKLLDLQYCTYERYFAANQLHHDVLNIYC